MTSGNGLLPRAFPTARMAFGFPMCFAMRLYVLILPRGIPYSASSTFLWNPEHWSSSSKSRLNLMSSPVRKRLMDFSSCLISFGVFSGVVGNVSGLFASSSMRFTLTSGVSLQITPTQPNRVSISL